MTGAVIALLVKEPALAVPLSFLSHFACDLIPHFGVRDDEEVSELFTRKFNIILVVDFLVAVSLMVILGFLFPAQRLTIWACMVAAALPDAMWAYHRLYVEHIKKRKPKLDWLAKFHHLIQWSQTYYGIFVELAWFTAMGVIILAQR